MQPRNHLLETYRDLTARGRKSVVGRLEKGQSFLVGQERRPQVIGTAARAWRPADVALNRIDQAIVAMGEAVFDVWSNAELTVEAKRARAQVAYAEAKATTDSDVEIVRSAADSVTETLRTAAYPSRPEPRDAAQEAAIAGIKSDLMLVLGNVEADVTLIRTMTSQLS